MTRQSSSLVRWLLVCVFAALGATAGEGTQPKPKPSLYDELRREQAKLAELQARLDKVRSGVIEPEPEVKPEPPAATKPEPAQEAPRDEADAPKTPEPKSASTPLVDRPSVGAADVLYRLGRHQQAREVYEALLARKGVSKDDHIWAGLQAGNCCRRLGDFDGALAHYQSLEADFPDHPWTRGHVAWALKTALWQKRWERDKGQGTRVK